MTSDASRYSLREIDASSLNQLVPARLFDLSGKVAVVTGAAGGLGSWLSVGLAAAGASVVVADHPAARIDDVVSGITEAGGSAVGAAIDLLEDDGPNAVAARAIEYYGRLDILVNNAGVNRREPIFQVTDDSWNVISKLDLRVPYELSRLVAKTMVERGGGGAIIHIGSLNNAIGLEGVSVYGAHKAGLVQLSKSMAVEWTRYSIRVNAICPGFMLTPLSKPLWEDDRRGAWIVRRSPMRRPGYPEELVGTCHLLASEAGSFITGQTIYVDGGWMAGTPWTDEVG